MAILLKWSGDGLSTGSLTTSSAGTGDTAPSAIGGPAGKAKVEDAGVRPPQIWFDQSISTTNSTATWTIGANRTVYAVRFYFSIGALPASGSAGLAVGRPLGSGISWRLDVTNTGLLRFRGDAGAAIDSPTTNPLSTGTVYRAEIVVNNGAAAYYIYQGDTMTLVYSRTSGLTVGTNFGDLLAGQVNGTLENLRFDDIAISDQASLIGPAVAPAPSSSTWWWNGTTYIPLKAQWWNGTNYVPIDRRTP